METKKIAIYGSGDFGQEVFKLIESINESSPVPIYKFIGFVDDTKEIGTQCRYGTVIGDFQFLNSIDFELNVVIAVGNSKSLMKMKENLINEHLIFPNLLSPTNVYFDKNSLQFGIGNIILSNSILSFDVKIGSFNIVNTRVNFGHHVEIGDFNILNPNVQLSGNVKIGSNNSLGLNCAFLPQKTFGDFNVVVPGALITRNFKNNNFLSGNPAVNIKL